MQNMKIEKKIYERPAMLVCEVDCRQQLLAGSVGTTSGDAGATIDITIDEEDWNG